MGSLYYPQLIDVLEAAGVRCGTNGINEGWERRARSSGGFNAPPLGVVFHHTASAASVNSDLNYMIVGSPDKPIGNMLLDRTGMVWPIAAGAANTQGKGGPRHSARVPVRSIQGNTYLWAIEGAEQWGWPGVAGQLQIDQDYFRTTPRSTRCSAISSPTLGDPHAFYTSHRGLTRLSPGRSKATWQTQLGEHLEAPGAPPNIRDEATRRATPRPHPTAHGGRRHGPLHHPQP